MRDNLLYAAEIFIGYVNDNNIKNELCIGMCNDQVFCPYCLLVKEVEDARRSMEINPKKTE